MTPESQPLQSEVSRLYKPFIVLKIKISEKKNYSEGHLMQCSPTHFHPSFSPWSQSHGIEMGYHTDLKGRATWSMPKALDWLSSGVFLCTISREISNISSHQICRSKTYCQSRINCISNGSGQKFQLLVLNEALMMADFSSPNRQIVLADLTAGREVKHLVFEVEVVQVGKGKLPVASSLLKHPL